jgi:DNA-binding transcriptional MerR regulator
MKTGVLAKRFDLDPKTVTAWTDMFGEFFTSKARGEGRTQRDYQIEDLWVINTIRLERAQNAPFEQIRARLASGDLDTNLPPEFTTIDGDRAITVYAQLKSYELQIDTLTKEVERLRSDSKEKDELIQRLNREIGKWQAMYEMLKEHDDENK